ncbi:putative aconitase with swiveling domain [Caballeronia udeis]|jgi:predicted aconitase with swiveling domain|uniref:Aconitase with swiveling domain n=1 Tax=Caballeronia udeis TaxID=1232866 RepID=A0ABW8MEV0_9BURK
MTNNSEVVSGSAKAATAGRVLTGDVLVAGAVQAEKIVLGKPLSFWGGYDSQAGEIIDRTHPLVGHSLTSKIMVMAHAKGSSSSSSVLAEAIRNGTGPVGIVLRERDLIISIGAIVAAELYNLDVPVVCLEAAAFDEVVSASGPLRIEAVGGEGGARVYLDSRQALRTR